MLDIKQIEELKTLCVNLEVISVYDSCEHSVPQMLYMLKCKLNEVIQSTNHDKETLYAVLKEIFDYMKDLSGEVSKYVRVIIQEMLDDGRLADVINKEIFGLIQKGLADLTAKVEQLEKDIKRVETELTDKIEEVDERLDSKIDRVETDLADRIASGDKHLQDQIDALEQGGGGGGGSTEPPDLTPALNNNNFATDVKGGKIWFEEIECTGWVYTVPKANGELVQGYAEYYRNNPLNHAPDTTYNKYDIMDDIAIEYNSTICLTGSPNMSDGTGFMGVNIDKGVIKTDKTDGWFTCGIDANQNLRVYMPEVKASTIKGDGCQDAFCCMMPLVMNSSLPPKEYIDKWGYNQFYEDKHPRTIFGEDKKGNWFFMTIHGRTKGQKGVTYASLCSMLLDRYNLRTAVAMDGGGSTEICINNSKVNWNIENYGLDRRKRPHSIVFRKQDKPKNKSQQEAYEMSKLVSQLSDREIRGESQRGVFLEQILGQGVIDPNTIRRSGIYWVRKDTPNAPGGISYGILHFEIEPGARMQFAFPYADNGYRIMMRRLNSAGEWGNWVYPEGNSREVLR